MTSLRYVIHYIWDGKRGRKTFFNPSLAGKWITEMYKEEMGFKVREVVGHVVQRNPTPLPLVTKSKKKKKNKP